MFSYQPKAFFFLFSFFIPPRSCSLLAALHLSNTQECKTMLTHHSVSLPPISSVCLTISIPGAASQSCKAVLILHVNLEILVTYVQHQFSFSWLQGISFLKINLKTYGVACVLNQLQRNNYFLRIWPNFHHLTLELWIAKYGSPNCSANPYLDRMHQVSTKEGNKIN